MDKKEKLQQESLKDNSYISSTIHSIDKISIANVAPQNYPIPQKYNKTKIVLLPVNTKKSYLYWEIEDTFLNSLGICFKDIEFHIINEKKDILYKFSCTSSIGEYFINHQFNSFLIQAVAGYYKEGVFVNIFTPSNSLKIFDKEIKYEKKQNDMRILNSSLEDFSFGISSSQNFSSTTVTTKGK